MNALKKWWVVGALVWAGSSVACGGESTLAGTGGGSGAAGAAGDAGAESGGEAGDGGSAGSGAASGSGGSAGITQRTGRITVGFSPRLSFAAWFDGAEGHQKERCSRSDTPCACRYTPVDDCIVDYCISTTSTSPTPTAGVISIENLRTGLSREVAPDSLGQYGGPSSTALDGFDVVVGDRLRIAAAGAEVPAFEATLTVGERLELLEPDPRAGLELRESNALPVRWGGTPREIRVDISTADRRSGALVTSYCRLRSASGRAEVPSAAIAPLLADTDASTYFVAAESTDVVAGDWSVRVSVGNVTTPPIEAKTVVR